MIPVLSIIIPCYNHGIYLIDAVQSVECYPNKQDYEIIIVNDGSSDTDTIQILNTLSQKGYTVLHQPNLGLSAARNNGIRISKGIYLLILDADNKIRPSYIHKGIEVLDANHEVGIVYGDCQFFGEIEKKMTQGKFSKKKILIENYIDACVIMRKKIWEEANGYDTAIPEISDWDLHLTALSNNWSFHYIPEILFDYRVRSDAMSRTHKKHDEHKNYIAKKHSLLYRNAFLETITIKARIMSVLKDVWEKLKGNPQY